MPTADKISEEKNFSIFYSWQSDLPNATNRQAIRSALRTAFSAVETKNQGLRIELDEATRGEAGSPSIPHTILEKIKTCDAFVCDITTINALADLKDRRTPNPNVLFELGYAVAHIGWGRIVMLFNEEFGTIKSDVPFDISTHRIGIYRLTLEKPKDKAAIKHLSDLTIDAISVIIDEQPLKPFSALQQTPDEIKRQKDVANIKWVMATIHLPTVYDMILSLPRQLTAPAVHFWELFNDVFSNPLFHIYDEDIKDTLLSIHHAWRECISHDGHYRDTPNQKIYIFTNPMDMPLNKQQQQAWEAIDSARATLKTALDKLLATIRQRFIEIDIHEMSSAAQREYVACQK